MPQTRASPRSFDGVTDSGALKPSTPNSHFSYGFAQLMSKMLENIKKWLEEKISFKITISGGHLQICKLQGTRPPVPPPGGDAHDHKYQQLPELCSPADSCPISSGYPCVLRQIRAPLRLRIQTIVLLRKLRTLRTLRRIRTLRRLQGIRRLRQVRLPRLVATSPTNSTMNRGHAGSPQPPYRIQ